MKERTHWMITTTYSLKVDGFEEVGFRLESRKGVPVVLLRQSRSWICLPLDAWDSLAEAIDAKIDESGEVETDDAETEPTPELGKLFRSTVTPAKWRRDEP